MQMDGSSFLFAVTVHSSSQWAITRKLELLQVDDDEWATLYTEEEENKNTWHSQCIYLKMAVNHTFE
jgi:hypothetical protein